MECTLHFSVIQINKKIYCTMFTMFTEYSASTWVEGAELWLTEMWGMRQIEADRGVAESDIEKDTDLDSVKGLKRG